MSIISCGPQNGRSAQEKELNNNAVRRAVGGGIRDHDIVKPAGQGLSPWVVQVAGDIHSRRLLREGLILHFTKGYGEELHFQVRRNGQAGNMDFNRLGAVTGIWINHR